MLLRCHILTLLLLISSIAYAEIGPTVLVRKDSATIVSDSISAAQDSVRPKRKFFLLRLLDKALDVDSNYIESNKFKVTILTQGDWRYKTIRLRANDDEGHHQSLYFSPKSQVTVGPYFGYSLLFLGITLDIGTQKLSDHTNTYFSIYAPMFGFDYYAERDVNGYRISNMSGFNKEITKASEGMRFPGLSSNMRYFHFYYIFNHRHFSYPAAYAQSTIQRKSTGAFIFGYNYSRQKINFDYEKLPSPFYDADGNLLINEGLKVHEVKYINHSFSLGYSFNWVFAHNWLFNLTASPSIGYNFTKGERFSSEKIYRLRNVNFDFIGRTAIVWNSQRLFAGGLFTAHTYAYKQATFSCQNSLFYAQLYMGINLWRKKK